MKFVLKSCRLRMATGMALVAGASISQAQVAVVVDARSPAESITIEQAAALFLGKTNKVPGLASVSLVEQADSSPVRELFHAKVAGRTPAQVRAAWARLVFTGKALPPREAPDSAEVKRLLAADPGAVGYIEKNAVDATVKVLLLVE